MQGFSEEPPTSVLLCSAPNGAMTGPRNWRAVVRKDEGAFTQITRVWNNRATVHWH